MKQFILYLALAVSINVVSGRAVSKKAPSNVEQPPEQPDEVAVSQKFCESFNQSHIHCMI